MLNPNLDRAALAAEFSRDGRVRIKDVLDPDVAEFLDGITLGADGKAVVVEIQYPVAKALEKADKHLKRVIKGAGGPDAILKRFAPKPKPAKK